MMLDGNSLPPAEATGKDYWRSLDHLADSPEFRTWLDEEFPNRPVDLLDTGVDRRRFLVLMAASFGLAGLTGCRRPEMPILPYTRRPEGVATGLPTYYATTIPGPGGGAPTLVESHEGRPTKIEGNPRHPASMGKCDGRAQAAILDLYDPDRSRTVLHEGNTSSWTAYDEFAGRHFAALQGTQGRGLFFLTEGDLSPAVALLREETRQRFPQAAWIEYEPVSDEAIRAGTALAFGSPYAVGYDFDKADVVLSLDADFLGTETGAVRAMREFSGRRVPAAGGRMNRLYVVENHPTVTGTMADHRLRLKAGAVPAYALQLARTVLAREQNAPADLRAALNGVSAAAGVPATWLNEVAADLASARGRSLVIAGRRQPPLVHALALLLNQVLGNLGPTVTLRTPPARPTAALSTLTDALQAGRVNTLVILGGNPVQFAPADAGLAERLPRVAHTIHLSRYADETSAVCKWHLPASHFLESWGDAETADGTYGPVQPLIAPLYPTRCRLEVLARLLRYETTQSREILQRSFRGRSGLDDDASFRRWLHEGFLENSAWPTATPQLAAAPLAEAIRSASLAPGEGLEVSFHPDATLLDGRFANNGWLQECPDPITKLVWDNAAVVSPRTAREQGLNPNDVVRLTLAGRSIDLPVFLLPGQADGSISVSLGYGRTRAGRVGNGVGTDVAPLRTLAAPWFRSGVGLEKTGRRHVLASTQDHGSMEGRDLIRVRDVNAPAGVHPGPDGPRLAGAGHGNGRTPLNLAEPPPLDGRHQWGMVIDLSKCTGCSACMIACQSENNLPIVGKEEVQRGRSMHWMRMDRYFQGPVEEPAVLVQPVPCQHCEAAPCETVCPVNAAVHSPEGLNLQVYNRCIGTRYCANNCPYKARRFNWFDYNNRPEGPQQGGTTGMPETLRMQKNPDVTVRMRGIMEKCTFCVQRIERGKIGARLAGGPGGEYDLPDGTIQPACVQTCPAEAIVFGDLRNESSRVSRARRDGRHYALLEELNTRPRVTYQVRLRNPNPRMGGGDAEGRD